MERRSNTTNPRRGTDG